MGAPSPRRTRIVTAAFVLYTILAVYWTVEYVGPGRVIGEWQVARWGEHRPLYTILILSIPVVVLSRILLGGQPPDFDALFGGWIRGRRARDAALPALVLVLGVGLSAVLWQRALAADVGSVEVTELAGRTGVYADVRGHPIATIAIQEDTLTPVAYVALNGVTDVAREARAVLAIPADRLDEVLQRDGDEVHARGYVDTDLPGELPVWVEARGATLAEGCLLVHTTLTPESSRTTATMVPLGFLVIAAIVYGRNRFTP